MKRIAGSGGKTAKLVGAAEAVLGTDAKGQSSMYDTRSGYLLTVVLLFVIGWIPTIGQMVAGYVGGRRAGSPLRGFVTGILGAFSVVAILLALTFSLNMIDATLMNDPEGKIAAIASSSPFLEQLLNAVLSYARQIFGNADLTIDYTMYMVTIPFGVIGGVLADQSQKEARLLIRRSMKTNERTARSAALHKEGKTMGFVPYDQYTKMGTQSTAVPADRTGEPAKASPSVRTERTETPVTTSGRMAQTETTVTTSEVPEPAKKSDKQPPADDEDYI